MAKNKWYSFDFISFKEKVYILTGLLMIVANSITDMFSNVVSNNIFNFTQGIFLICSFVFVFFRFTQSKGLQFKNTVQNREGGDIKDGEDQLKNKETPMTEEHLQIKGELVDKLFPVIRSLAFVFLITNILSCGYYFYDTLYYQKQHVTVSQSDILTINELLSLPINTQTQILDSINSRFPKQVFFSAGKIINMKLDSAGTFCYFFVLQNKGKTSSLSVSSLKIRFTNFTECKEQKFCLCDSTNICLKDRRIELYYLLFPKKTKKGDIIDTTYFSRIQ